MHALLMYFLEVLKTGATLPDLSLGASTISYSLWMTAKWNPCSESICHWTLTVQDKEQVRRIVAFIPSIWMATVGAGCWTTLAQSSRFFLFLLADNSFYLLKFHYGLSPFFLSHHQKPLSAPFLFYKYSQQNIVKFNESARSFWALWCPVFHWA